MSLEIFCSEPVGCFPWSKEEDIISKACVEGWAGYLKEEIKKWVGPLTNPTQDVCHKEAHYF